MNYVIVLLKGIAIGIANAVPGVSGGTIAVITKVFDKMMEALTLNIKKLIKNLPFLLPLGIGMAAGIFLSAKVLTYLLVEKKVPTQLFFLGVIIGSIPMIYKECIKTSKFKPLDILPLIIGLIIMVCFMFFANEENAGLIDELTVKTAVGIIASSFIAGVAMLIPGVSGSTLLKALGYHTMAMNAIAELNILVILLFAIGALSGVFVIAKILTILLAKFRKPTYCIILGLIIGSVPIIYPKEFRINLEGAIGIALMIFGLFLPTLMELPQRNRNKDKAE